MKTPQLIKPLFTIALFFFSVALSAQTDEISKTDVMKFERANQQIDMATQKLEQEKQKALQLEGMSQSEFDQLQRFRGNASKEALESYSRLSPLMMELQQNYTESVDAYISESGLDRMQYKMIESQYKTNPNFKKQLQEKQ